jgi:hypothetical protein
MNYPEEALIKSLISAIETKLPARTVYTIPPKDTSYPYILLNQTDMTEVGAKSNFIYRFEPLIQVIHKDLSTVETLLDDMQEIHEIITHATDDLTITGYDLIEMSLISTNRTTELYEWGRLDIGLIRPLIEIISNS